MWCSGDLKQTKSKQFIVHIMVIKWMSCSQSKGPMCREGPINSLLSFQNIIYAIENYELILSNFVPVPPQFFYARTLFSC